MHSVNVGSVGSAPDSQSLAVSLLQLTKPRVTTLVMVTALAGALIAPAPRDTATILIALFGTALVVGSANSLNMFIERHSDALMTRTRTRPLPAGRLAPEIALWFGVGLAVVGLPLLALLVNVTTALLTLAALVSYVLAYTPLKQVSWLALLVGAVPGALPPLIGYASVSGTLSRQAWVLFAILFVWQLPHFLAIAIFRSEEYARAGHRVLPVVRGVAATKRAIVWYSALLVLTTLLPFAHGMASPVYLVAALLSGGAFFGYAWTGLADTAGDAWAKRLFRASIPYLVLVLVTLVVTQG
jgi:protoheme IX farnesyltransferase